MIPLGILAAQAPPAPAGAYELISSTILTSSAASVTFSSIPQDYKHLQIRAVTRTSHASFDNDPLKLIVNSDTGTNYAYHYLYGTGSSVLSTFASAASSLNIGEGACDTLAANIFSATVIDVLDYKDTSKNSTFRALSGLTTENIRLNSGLWINTAAVTALQFSSLRGANLVAGSRFSLYGIRG